MELEVVGNLSRVSWETEEESLEGWPFSSISVVEDHQIVAFKQAVRGLFRQNGRWQQPRACLEVVAGQSKDLNPEARL
jgi:hypothetical protein